MRNLVKGAALALVTATALALTACGPASAPEPTAGPPKHQYTVMTADEVSRWLVYFPFQHGLVKSDTVDLDFQFLPFAAAQQASGTRQYDLVEINPITTVAQNDAGVTSEIISAGLTDLGSTRVYVQKDSPIKTLADLKGKRVGAVSLPTSYVLATRIMMKDAGLNPALEGGDVQFSAIAAPPQLISTLESGGLDAIITSGAAGTYPASTNPNLREIYDTYKGLKKVLPGPTTVTSINMYTGPDSIDKADVPEIRRMFAEARDYYAANKDEIIKTVAEEHSVDIELVKWVAKYLELAPSPLDKEQTAWIKGFLGYAVDLGMIKAAPDVSTLIAK
jgi:ABC-type nitrate/sulfonate/bicarbonate transport system substrate-binding protein